MVINSKDQVINCRKDLIMLNKAFKPMTLRPINEVPNSEDYVHQLKWDGHRALFHYDNGFIRIFTREQNECTLQYPELQLIKLPVKNCILDGEVIVLNNEGGITKPCFEDVMTRFSAQKQSTIIRLQTKMPVHLVVWDILYLNNKSLLHEVLEIRLVRLSKVIKPSEWISVTETHKDGESLYQEVLRLGLEGIVSKKLGTNYYLNSLGPWYKKKAYLYETVTIGAIRKRKFGWRLTLNDKYVGTLEFAPNGVIADTINIFIKQIISGENEEWFFIKPSIRCKIKFQCYTQGLLGGLHVSGCFFIAKIEIFICNSSKF